MPDSIDVAIGARIRARRKNLGIAQVKLAEALGVTFQQVQKYERGDNRVSASALVRIAETLNLGASYFLGEGEDVATQQVWRFSEGDVALLEALRRIRSARLKAHLLRLVEALASEEGGASSPSSEVA